MTRAARDMAVRSVELDSDGLNHFAADFGL
jgi:hypothetical protein